jgi:3-hydroxyisobutyrate dehydrogenase-like beta-hydroxyacid dehydrogenase
MRAVAFPNTDKGPHQMTKIAVLGLGAMGSRMALNLVKVGHDVVVWNRDPAKAVALGQAGGRIAGSPAAAAASADVVLSMVTDDAAARAVWLDPSTGALTRLKRGAVAIECSTVSPEWIAELASAAKRQGVGLLDAPVAGSRPQAEAGELIFMVGGDVAAMDSVRPVLDPLAAKILYVGATGQGARLKLAVNALFAIQLAGVAELLALLTRSGFTAAAAAEMFAQFPIVSPPIAGAAKMMAAKNTSPQFTVDLIEKDLGYVIEAAKACGAELPSSAVARAAFQAAQAKGQGSSNVSALASVFA